MVNRSVCWLPSGLSREREQGFQWNKDEQSPPSPLSQVILAEAFLPTRRRRSAASARSSSSGVLA